MIKSQISTFSQIYTFYSGKYRTKYSQEKMNSLSGIPLLCPRKERKGVFMSLQKTSRASFPHFISGLTERRLSVRRDHENKIHEKTENLVSSEY